MKMLANNILVDPEAWPTQKQGSIVLPDTQKSRALFSRGTVKGVGPGPCLPSGEHSPIEMNVGDCILYHKAAAIPIVVHGKEMHIVVEREVLAILDPNDLCDEGETDAAN